MERQNEKAGAKLCWPASWSSARSREEFAQKLSQHMTSLQNLKALQPHLIQLKCGHTNEELQVVVPWLWMVLCLELQQTQALRMRSDSVSASEP